MRQIPTRGVFFITCSYFFLAQPTKLMYRLLRIEAGLALVLAKEWSELRGRTCESLNLASAGEQKNLGVRSAFQALCCRGPSGHRHALLVGASHAVNPSRDGLSCVAGVSPDVRRWRFVGEPGVAVRRPSRLHSARRLNEQKGTT